MNQTEKNQKKLGLYAKTGKEKPLTSIPSNTIQYRTLVYNNIQDTMDTTFPLTVNLLGKNQWKFMVNYFFKLHPCLEPQLWRLPAEFLEFAQNHFTAVKERYPFLIELLTLEWSEVDVFMMQDIPIQHFNSQGDLYRDAFVINPEMKFFSFEYPIFKKQAKDISLTDKGYYFLAVYRHLHTKDVLFHEFGPQYIQILMHLSDHPINLDTIKHTLDFTKSIHQKDLVDFIHFCLEHGVIIGYKPQ